MGVRLALAVSVVLALGAACDGGDPSPTTLPTSPPTSSSPAPPTTAAPTTPPAPTPPTLPAAAHADSPAGAEAFARFYIQALDYAYQAQDTQLLRKLAQCSGCTSVADGIDKWSSAGGRYEGGRLRVTSSEVVNHVKGSAGLVSVIYSRTDRVLVSANGEREKVAGAPALNVIMTERRTSGGWLITEIQVVK